MVYMYDCNLLVNLETARLFQQCVKKGLQEDRQEVNKQLRAGKYFIIYMYIACQLILKQRDFSISV